MPITDLTNTTWIFNDFLDFTDLQSYEVGIAVNFISNEILFDGLSTYIRPSTLTRGLNYQIEGENNFVYSVIRGKTHGNWLNNNYKIIHIIDGLDVQNQTKINKLQHLATLITSKYSVTTHVYPTGGGTTSGDGQYTDRTNFTVSATPTVGSKYNFVNWTDTRSGNIVSTSATYTSTNYGEQSISLTANFEYEGYKPSTDPSQLPSDYIIDTKASDWMKHGDTKMYTIYVPQETSSVHELQGLASWLYSQDFLSVVGQLITGLADAPRITDYIISLMVLPVSIPTEANTKAVKVGFFQPTTSYGQLAMHYTKNNVVELDCGTVSVAGIYGGALDYQTNCDIYLPFIGYQSLETYDVIGHSINPIYQIDLLTGDCICKIKIDSSVKYQFTGQCGYSIPLSEISNNGTISKGIKGAIALGTAIAGVPPVGGSTTTLSTDIKRTGKKKLVTSATTTKKYTMDRPTREQRNVKMAEAIGSFANMGNGASRSGSLQGNTGYMGIGKPYLNITRPRVDIPSNFGKYNGFPCNKYLSLNGLQGFTMVEDIHLTGFTCTDDELDEIGELLSGGIIL